MERIKNPEQKDFDRLLRYRRAWRYLRGESVQDAS